MKTKLHDELEELVDIIRQTPELFSRPDDPSDELYEELYDWAKNADEALSTIYHHLKELVRSL